MSKRAFVGADVFNGRKLHAGKALLLEDGIYQGYVDPHLIPNDFRINTLTGGTLMR